jgi:broad specificity phosphatase PhoE
MDVKAGSRLFPLQRSHLWLLIKLLTFVSRSAQQVSDRLDSLIAKIRNLQGPHMTDDQPADVLLVAHGHILRAFVKRWLGYPLDFRLLLMLEPGGVGIVT